MIKQVFFARLVLKRTENVFNKNKINYLCPELNRNKKKQIGSIIFKSIVLL